MGACSSSSKGYAIKNGGGFTYTTPDGYTQTFKNVNGKVYNVSEVSQVPQLMRTNKSATQLAQTAAKNGNSVTILSPADMNKREGAIKAEREATSRDLDNLDAKGFKSAKKSTSAGRRTYNRTRRSR